MVRDRPCRQPWSLCDQPHRPQLREYQSAPRLRQPRCRASTRRRRGLGAAPVRAACACASCWWLRARAVQGSLSLSSAAPLRESGDSQWLVVGFKVLVSARGIAGAERRCLVYQGCGVLVVSAYGFCRGLYAQDPFETRPIARRVVRLGFA
ncbi:hypothetical protein BDZ88DRAFT_408369 [Geranomyces variabilis]|nr:hypothetical protein BDZ88DRAFT_408369 [Geranomyces variabilis]